MAHGITEKDHMVSGENITPWHNLGTVVEGKMTSQEALTKAKLDWTVVQEPVEFLYGEKYQVIEGKFANIREDTGDCLGIVGDRYTICQNSEAFKFLDKLVMDSNGANYTTAGSLFGGTSVWALLVLPDFITMTGNDRIDKYILFSNRHDNKKSMLIKNIATRVVCNNTLTMGLSEKTTRQIKLRHHKKVMDGVAKSQDALGIFRDQFNSFELVMKEIANHDPTEEQIELVLNKMLPNESKRAENSREKVLDIFSNNDTIFDTSTYSLYQALTYYSDHELNANPQNSTKEDAEFYRRLMGTGSDFKDKALETCYELVLN